MNLFDAVMGSSKKGSVVYTPSVSDDGVISWTNNGGLENPEPVNIKGADGKDGKDGTTVLVDNTTGENYSINVNNGELYIETIE